MDSFDPSYYSSEDYEMIAKEDFMTYDKNRNGFIEVSELKEILNMQSERIEAMGLSSFKVDDELVNKTLQKYNKDKDAKLNYKEFRALSKDLLIEYMKEFDKVPVDDCIQDCGDGENYDPEYGDNPADNGDYDEDGNPINYEQDDDVQPEDYDQNDDYGANDDGQNNDYGQNEDDVQPEDYGQNDDGQNDDFGQPEDYDQNDDYGQPEDYKQDDDFGQNDDIEQPEEEEMPKKVVKPKNPAIPSKPGDKKDIQGMLKDKIKAQQKK